MLAGFHHEELPFFHVSFPCIGFVPLDLALFKVKNLARAPIKLLMSSTAFEKLGQPADESEHLSFLYLG